jgi:hypothetical protein
VPPWPLKALSIVIYIEETTHTKNPPAKAQSYKRERGWFAGHFELVAPKDKTPSARTSPGLAAGKLNDHSLPLPPERGRPAVEASGRGPSSRAACLALDASSCWTQTYLSG